MKQKLTALLMAASCLFLGVGCGTGGGSGSATINIGCKPMTEQYIITEMMKQLIEDRTDLNVKITQGLTTDKMMPAMEKGDLDLYPEYTGTAWKIVLKQDSMLDSAQLFEQLNAEYQSKYHMEWLNLYGFDNAYALGLPEQIAAEKNITTISELAPHSGELVFGAENDFFEREDGYAAMINTYGLQFKDKVEMDIGLRYQALQENRIQVLDVFTTDAQLKTAGLRILEDDKKFFPIYDCGTIVRQQALEDHPELRAVLDEMDGLITQDDMIQMNYELEIDKRHERDIARDFLRRKGLLQ